MPPHVTISVIEKRLMSPNEAAGYCGLSLKDFRSACTATPKIVQTAHGKKKVLFDKFKVDEWINSLDNPTSNNDKILETL